MPIWLDAARLDPFVARPVGVSPSGPFQLPAPWTQSTSPAPLLSTTNTSVWLGKPNWFETASPAPEGARPGGELASGPFQLPAPWTHSTRAVPLLSTTNTSVWLGKPNWFETARWAPGGASPGGLVARGPFQLPAPWTQSTSLAPLLSTTNTSVWLGKPNWFETARWAPGGASPGGLMARGPFQLPAPWTQRTWTA